MYSFKVEARNLMGYSFLSEIVSILAAQIPAQPQAPVTTFDSDNLIVSWVAPDDGGSIITSYTIYVRTSDESVFLT